MTAFEPIGAGWEPLVWMSALLSMTVGNFAALLQSNIKRMLAYSSIAHAGYVLIGVLVVSQVGLWSVLFYLLTYSFVTLGAFGTVILLERREYAGETAADYAGLSRRSPFLPWTGLDPLSWRPIAIRRAEWLQSIVDWLDRRGWATEWLPDRWSRGPSMES